MNLGNTCFFNSVMQSIGQTDYLRHRLNALVEGVQQQRLTLQVEQQQLDVVVTGKPGQLTKTLHAFMKDIATPTGRTLNPRPIFSQICEKAPRFRSYQQQDSQELLRYLLDALKTEEIQRMRQGILAVFKVSSGKKAALGHLSPSDKDTIKKFGNAVYGEPTYVDEVFGGVLFSTITCAECHSCSTIHENYLDLSLPVPRDQVKLSESEMRAVCRMSNLPDFCEHCVGLIGRAFQQNNNY
jgi:ubiquitin carboxyl-terminal hydrolase 16/45